MSKALVLGAAALVFSAAGALAGACTGVRRTTHRPGLHSTDCCLRGAARLPGTTTLCRTTRDDRLLRSASGSAGADTGADI
jgi:hypothetical protein